MFMSVNSYAQKTKWNKLEKRSLEHFMDNYFNELTSGLDTVNVYSEVHADNGGKYKMASYDCVGWNESKNFDDAKLLGSTPKLKLRKNISREIRFINDDIYSAEKGLFIFQAMELWNSAWVLITYKPTLYEDHYYIYEYDKSGQLLRTCHTYEKEDMY